MASLAARNKKRAPSPALQYEPDTEAIKAYRDGRKPTSIVPIPGPFHRWVSDSSNISRGPRISNLTSTHIILSLKDRCFKIWGPEANVELSKSLLQDWMADVSGKVERHFGRINAYRWLNTVLNLQRNELAEDVQSFRKLPDPQGFYAPVIYGIEWQFSRPPQQMLGENLEALDDMRMELQCWIDCRQVGPNEWMFGVLSLDKAHGYAAARRLARNIHWNAASLEPDISGKFYLVKPTPSSSMKLGVKFADNSKTTTIFEGTELLSSGNNVHIDSPKYAIFEGIPLNSGSWEKILRTSDLITNNANSVHIEFWLSELLKPMRYFIGRISMRATIGMAGWTKYPKVISMDLENFEKLIRDRNNQKNPISSKMLPLPTRLGEDVLHRFLECNKFVPANPWRLETELQNKGDTDISDLFPIPPPSQITVVFELHECFRASVHQTSGSISAQPDRRLTKTFTQPTEPGDVLWERLPDPNSVLDITILDLVDPGLSHNLSISRGIPMSPRALLNMAEYLRSFGEEVKVLPSAFEGQIAQLGRQAFKMPGESTTLPERTLKSLQFPDLESVKQETIWRFTCKSNPGFKVDVVLVQEFDIEKMYLGERNAKFCIGAQLHPVGISAQNLRHGDDQKHAWKGDPRPYHFQHHARRRRDQQEQNWIVRVWHEVWDEKMSQNIGIKAGERADWVDAEWEFFPTFDSYSKSMQVGAKAWGGRVHERGSGIKEWLRVMNEVEGVIAQVEKQVEKQEDLLA